MATWKRLLTTDDIGSDAHLGNANLSNGGTVRTYTVGTGSSLTLQTDHSGGAQVELTSVSTTPAADTLKLQATKIQFDAVNSASGAIISLSEGSNNGTDLVNIKAPNALSASYTLTLPADDGDTDQVLTTDGSGNLSWEDVTGGGGVTINNNTNNYLLTASGTANTINGESNITWNGNTLDVNGYVEYRADALGRTGEYYDASESGRFESTGSISAGDIISIPKGSASTAFKVYTINSGAGAGSGELLSAANTSTNINQIAMIAPGSGQSTTDYYLRGMLTVPASSINGTFSSSHGDPLYLDPAANGVLTLTPPTSTSTYRRMMGYVINGVTISSVNHYIIWFDPSPEYVKIT